MSNMTERKLLQNAKLLNYQQVDDNYNHLWKKSDEIVVQAFEAATATILSSKIPLLDASVLNDKQSTKLDRYYRTVLHLSTTRDKYTSDYYTAVHRLDACLAKKNLLAAVFVIGNRMSVDLRDYYPCWLTAAECEEQLWFICRAVSQFQVPSRGLRLVCEWLMSVDRVMFSNAMIEMASTHTKSSMSRENADAINMLIARYNTQNFAAFKQLALAARLRPKHSASLFSLDTLKIVWQFMYVKTLRAA